MRKQTGGLTVFTVGGTVQAGPGIYIRRKADEELLSLCRKGDFAYVLTARQMGKSSLMVGTAERLSAEGIKSLTIDLTKIGGAKEVTDEKWYLGLLVLMAKRLGLKVNIIQWWQARAHLSMAHRLTDFFEEVLLAEVPERVVIFIDEIDTTLRLSFTDDFYAAIRYLYNDRSKVESFRRLSFVLIGVATPSELIHNPDQTPFNIGQRVDLTDFTIDESLYLATGFQMSPEAARQVLGWVRDWTNGHPYLTQRLCRVIADQQREVWTEEDVAQLVASTFLGEKSKQDNNLQFVADMLTKRAQELEQVEPAEVLLIYDEIRRGQKLVTDDEQSLLKSHLKLSGVVCHENGLLKVRNRVYREVFDEAWVKAALPPTWVKRQLKRTRGIAAALAAGLVLVTALTIVATSFAIEASKQSQLAESRLVEAERLREVAEMNSEEARRNSEEALKQKVRAEDALQQVEQQKRQVEQQRSIAVVERNKAEQFAVRESKARQQAERAAEEKLKQRNLAELRGEANTLLSLGNHLLRLEKYDEARISLTEAQNLYTKVNDSSGVANSLEALAATYFDYADVRFVRSISPSDDDLEKSGLPENKRNYSEAVKYLKKVVDINRPLGKSKEEAVIRSRIGEIYKLAGKRKEAADSYQQAVVAYSKIDDAKGEIEAEQSLVSVYEDAGDNRGVIDYFTTRISACHQAGDRQREVRAILNLAKVYKSAGDEDRALNMYEQLVDILAQTALLNMSIEYLSDADLRFIATAYENQADKDRAISFFGKLAQLTQGTGMFTVLQRLAEAQARAGKRDEAVKTLQNLTAKVNDSSFYNGKVTRMLQIAGLYSELGEKRLAAESYERSIQQTEGTPGSYLNSYVIANTRRILVDIYLELGEVEKSVKHYTQLEGAPVDDDTVLLEAAKKISDAYRMAGDKHKAEELMDKALQEELSASNDEMKIERLIDVGYYYKKVSEYPKAVGCFEDALAIYNKGARKQLMRDAWLYELIGASYFTQGNKQKTLEALDRALVAYKAHKNYDGALRMLFVRALVYNAWNDERNENAQLQEALAYYKSTAPQKELPLLISGELWDK